MKFLGTVLGASLGVIGAGASAATIDAGSLLSQFNTIALGDLTASSETEGAVYVGGNLVSNGYTVNSDRLPNGTLNGISGSLVVGGNVSGGSVNVNSGDVRVGGTISANVNLNVAGATRQQNVAGIPTETVRMVLETLSRDLAGYAQTPGASIEAPDQNIRRLSSGAGGIGPLDKIAIINTDATFFSGGGVNQNDLNIDSGVTTIVNVSGTDISLANNFNANRSDLLVNFYEADSLRFLSGTVGYSILAPFADISGTAGGVNGVVVGRNITQGIEYRPYGDEDLFTGDLPPTAAVPLPAAGLLMLGGLGGLAVVQRRRKSR